MGADGDGVAELASDAPLYVPFTLPGETVRVARQAGVLVGLEQEGRRGRDSGEPCIPSRCVVGVERVVVAHGEREVPSRCPAECFGRGVDASFALAGRHRGREQAHALSAG